MNNPIVKKILLVVEDVVPGLFLISYNLGTGSVVTMAKAGAEHGMSLFWTLALSCIFTYVLMVAYGKVTIVTGETALTTYKRHFQRYQLGRILALYVLATLIIGDLLALMGIMGIVTELLQEGSRLIWGGTGFSVFWITVVLVIGLYALLWNGQYKMFEKILTVFVILMAVSFVMVFFMVKPDLSAIVRGLVPSIPRTQGVMRLIAAMTGTTVSPPLLLVRRRVVDYAWLVSADPKLRDT